MDTLREFLSWACLLSGSGVVLITGFGILRLPTYYTRMHAASVTDTLGAGLILLGLALEAGFSLASLKLGMILLFLILTGPPAAHALAKAAFLHGVIPDLPEVEDHH
jgi:multicomponent Na+:H+ antiporter subunit G